MFIVKDDIIAAWNVHSNLKSAHEGDATSVECGMLFCRETSLLPTRQAPPRYGSRQTHTPWPYLCPSLSPAQWQSKPARSHVAGLSNPSTHSGFMDHLLG